MSRKIYSEMSRDELMLAADAWLRKHGGRAVAYQTASGDAGIVWHDQQGVPDDVIWTYAAKN